MERPRVVQSRFTEEGIYTSGRQSCHPRKGESHPDTGEGLLPCIFTAHQSGPYRIVRTPEDPIIQDSLNTVAVDATAAIVPGKENRDKKKGVIKGSDKESRKRASSECAVPVDELPESSGTKRSKVVVPQVK